MTILSCFETANGAIFVDQWLKKVSFLKFWQECKRNTKKWTKSLVKGSQYQNESNSACWKIQNHVIFSTGTISCKSPKWFPRVIQKSWQCLPQNLSFLPSSLHLCVVTMVFYSQLHRFECYIFWPPTIERIFIGFCFTFLASSVLNVSK